MVHPMVYCNVLHIPRSFHDDFSSFHPGGAPSQPDPSGCGGLRAGEGREMVSSAKSSDPSEILGK